MDDRSQAERLYQTLVWTAVALATVAIALGAAAMWMAL